MAMDEGMRTPRVGAALMRISQIKTAHSVVHICGWYF